MACAASVFYLRSTRMYLTTLRETIGRRQWRADRIWQQDNATAHTAKIVRSWLSENVKTLADWPPNSPDLSPIENLWGKLWPDAIRLRPKNADELWQRVEEKFREYDDQYIDSLILSFRRRLIRMHFFSFFPTSYTLTKGRACFCVEEFIYQNKACTMFSQALHDD